MYACAHTTHIHMCVASVLSKLQISELVSSLFAHNLLLKLSNVSNSLLRFFFCLYTCVQETFWQNVTFTQYICSNKYFSLFCLSKHLVCFERITVTFFLTFFLFWFFDCYINCRLTDATRLFVTVIKKILKRQRIPERVAVLP